MTNAAWLSRSNEAAYPADRVGTIVREFRLATGKSQVATASAMGMTQQFLSQLENGQRAVTLEQRRRFADVLGIPPESLGLASRLRPSVAADDATAEVATSRGRWRAQRHWLNRHRADLARLAVDWYPAEVRVPRTPLIADPSWIPAVPMDVEQIELALDEGPQVVEVTGREPQTLATRPLRAPGQHFDSYTASIKHLDPPQLFESRPSYRVLSGSPTAGMRFGLAAYFDKLDVSEALGHEMAITCANDVPATAEQLRGRLPFRELLGDPFDPRRRAIIPAITTLTIRLRRHPHPPTFLLHWRDPAKVATAAGIYDVIPAGEFQPSSVALWDRHADFSLWRNMVREFSEELLGAPEHDGTRTEPIDYAGWDLYQALERGRRDGTVTTAVLGMGLDALTLAATILTVVVIDDDVFTDVFGNTVRWNEEGEIVAVGDGRAADGVPFTAEAVDRMLTSEPMASPGAACLALAWQHRSHLLG